MTTRGIRLNNPGNIRHGDDWRGLTADQPDPSFCQFSAPVYGIRAIVKILLSYRARGLTTVHDIIHAWAPSSENDTGAYIADVAKRVGVWETDALDVRNRAVCGPLVKAIIFHENGVQPYAENTVQDAMTLAGL